ncbi:MAG: aldolase/citrate lyase family protein [Dehalococcoidia bacterium]
MPLRSVLRIDDIDGALSEALESAADAVLLPLTDETRAVGSLRLAARAAIVRVAGAGKKPYVLVNHPRTRLLRDDLDAVVMPQLAGVFLPHCVEPQDVRDTAVVLREFEYNREMEAGSVALFPVIDTARGLLRAAESAEAVPRVAGLVFSGEQYARDVGGRAEEAGPRLAYARGAVVAAARAKDGLPLVAGNQLEFRSMAQYGFAGAIVTDARGVALVNAAFQPSEAELERAQRYVEAYEAARAEGAWVARLGGEVIDAHRARRARQLLE